VKGVEAIHLFGAVGTQDEVEKGSFSFLKLLLLFCLAQVGVDADVVLTLVFAEVENLKGTVIFACTF